MYFFDFLKFSQSNEYFTQITVTEAIVLQFDWLQERWVDLKSVLEWVAKTLVQSVAFQDKSFVADFKQNRERHHVLLQTILVVPQQVVHLTVFD